MLYSLKAHGHYFFVFLCLETWRGAKLCIFTHFTFTNLPWCSQSMNQMIYIYTLYSIQIPSWSERCDHTSSYYRCPKTFFILPPDGYSFLTLDFPPTRVGFPLQGSQRICYRIGKVREIWYFLEKSGKSKGRKFLPIQIFNFLKNHMLAEMCAVESYMTISCIYDAIICI